MKTKIIWTTAILIALGPPLPAGQVPDIVWRTNANQFGSFSVVFAPDSKSVFSYGGDAKLWRVSDRSLLRTFAIAGTEIGAVAVSPDGTRLVASAPGRFRMWRVYDGAVLHAADAYYTPGLAFSPRGDFIARASSEGSSSVVLFSVSGGSISNGIMYDDIISQGVNAMTFSPDGTLLLFGGSGSIAMLMRVSDGVVVQTFYHSLYVNSVAFSPDGQTIATGVHTGDVRLWNTNGTLLHTLAGTGHTTRALDFSPDGKLLVTTSRGLIQFWRVADGAHLVTYDPDPIGPATTVDIAPDGKLFAYGGGELVVARMPLLFTEVSRAGNQLVLGWSGGGGLYQLQRTTNVVDGPWQNVGAPTAVTATTNAVTGTVFYRVQSLPNP